MQEQTQEGFWGQAWKWYPVFLLSSVGWNSVPSLHLPIRETGQWHPLCAQGKEDMGMVIS